MNITIQVSDTESSAAFSRVQAAALATEQHDISFNGDSINVEWGDCTCIAAGDGHADAGALYALVQRVIENEFERDASGYLLVPFASGGFARIVSDQA